MLKTILGIDQCRAKIAKIRRVGDVLQANIHDVAVGTLAHARDHGDVTVACDLVNALPSGQRKLALVEWYRKFSGKQMSVYKDRKSGLFVGKMESGWKADKFGVDAAQDITFGDLTKERAPGAQIDLKVLRKLVARVVENSTTINGVPAVTDKARSVGVECVQLIDRAIAAAV